MLIILLCLAGFMVWAMQAPSMEGAFDRPEGFYDNTLGKVGMALAFAAGVSAVVWVVGRFFKR